MKFQKVPTDYEFVYSDVCCEIMEELMAKGCFPSNFHQNPKTKLYDINGNSHWLQLHYCFNCGAKIEFEEIKEDVIRDKDYYEKAVNGVVKNE